MNYNKFFFKIISNKLFFYILCLIILIIYYKAIPVYAESAKIIYYDHITPYLINDIKDILRTAHNIDDFMDQCFMRLKYFNNQYMSHKTVIKKILEIIIDDLNKESYIDEDFLNKAKTFYKEFNKSSSNNKIIFITLFAILFISILCC